MRMHWIRADPGSHDKITVFIWNAEDRFSGADRRDSDNPNADRVWALSPLKDPFWISPQRSQIFSFFRFLFGVRHRFHRWERVD